MMAFGWRPQQSCYNTGAAANADNPSCPKPTWFYLLLAAAVVGGVVSKRK